MVFKAIRNRRFYSQQSIWRHLMSTENGSIKINFQERKQLEMMKRVSILRYRKECLEKELNEINIALRSIDKQLQRESSSMKFIYTNNDLYR